jgi:multiple sugar transport system ATP-binding protein
VASVELKVVTKVFSGRGRDSVRAVDELSLDISDGELVSFVGPSGSGKTTILRLIAGLESQTEGTITFGGAAPDRQAHRRDIAMVFQADALLAHLTVHENIALGLKLRAVPTAGIQREVEAAAEAMEVKRLLSRLPQQLSGGERQRVALARALVRRPKVFLFDEPLSSLDAPARSEMRRLIRRLHRDSGITMIYVTHDQSEALALGQRVAVLREGALQQIADPVSLYRTPANAFVASFVGSPPMNLIRGHIQGVGDQSMFLEHNVSGAANGTRVQAMLDTQRAQRFGGFADGNVILGIRAEHIHLSAPEQCHVSAELEFAEYLGADAVLHCTTGATKLLVRVPVEKPYRAGERIPLRLDLAQAVFFNPVSGRMIA